MTTLVVKGTTDKQVTITSKVSDVIWRLSLMFGPMGRAFLPPFDLAGEGKTISKAHLMGGI